MWQARDEIRVSIWDNGKGLPPNAGLKEGIGMSGMRERFGELGGLVSARNVADGFKLSGTIPYGIGDIIGPD
jgi:signal transduction histidine kinase